MFFQLDCLGELCHNRYMLPKLKQWRPGFSDLILIILLLFLIYKQLPIFLNNNKMVGKKISTQDYLEFTPPYPERKINFPLKKNAVVLFWATWCAPCKVEMGRFKRSVVAGKIKRESIFLIAPFESKLDIQKFLKKNDYPFTFIDAPELAGSLNIQVTPTILFLEENEITNVSTGISAVGIWKAEFFLKEK